MAVVATSEERECWREMKRKKERTINRSVYEMPHEGRSSVSEIVLGTRTGDSGNQVEAQKSRILGQGILICRDERTNE